MVIIGIDPGTAITGYGIVAENDRGILALLDYGVITTPAHLPLSDRLSLLYQRLKEILSFHQPNAGAVEKLYFQKNTRTALNVGQARGVAMLALAEAGLQVSEYNPLEVKQAVVGYGKAEKHQVQEMVRILLGLQQVPEPDDAADALAIAICHLHNTHLPRLSP